jgi:hypothetical protein
MMGTALVCFTATFFFAAVLVSFCEWVCRHVTIEYSGFGVLVWDFGSMGYFAVLGAGSFFLTLGIVWRRHGESSRIARKTTMEEYNRLPKEEKTKGMWECSLWMLVSQSAVFMAARVFGGWFTHRAWDVMTALGKIDTMWP